MDEDENLEISVISSAEETTLQQTVTTESRRSRIKRWCCNFIHDLLPNKKQCNLAVSKFFVLLLFSGAIYGIFKENAVPGSEIFALLLLALLAFIGGKIISILKFPPLMVFSELKKTLRGQHFHSRVEEGAFKMAHRTFTRTLLAVLVTRRNKCLNNYGMLLVGFLFRNLSFIPYYKDISHTTASIIRDISLVVILLGSGLGLDGKKLRRMKMVVVQLTFIPLLVETGSMAVFSHYFLKLPWLWGVMLGFIVSAISAAVVLPILIKLRRNNLGTDKGIPTLILAASSMDDIVAIAGFTVVLSIIFSEGNLTVILIKAPLEPLVGCAIGAVFGVIFWHLPSKEVSKASLIYYHILFLCFGGLSLMFVTVRIGIPGSGSLGCITLAFVASLRWRKDAVQFSGIESVISVLWYITEPFMFALIGAEVSIDNLHSNIGHSILVVVLAIICRMVITPFIMFGANLNVKEKIFVSLAWLPKATVQAAIGSRALDYARLNDKGGEYIMYGQQILTVSVLSIILTAPLGAALSSILAPYLLSKDTSASETSVNQEETDTSVKSPPANYGSCHQLQPSDILAPKAEQ